MTFPVTESPDPGSPIATVVLALCSLFPKKGLCDKSLRTCANTTSGNTLAMSRTLSQSSEALRMLG